MEKQERLEATVCREIGARTGGEILIGVVGPVRTGKSTLIKQFMEQLVLPAIENDDARLRARDELPQSAAGRTIMTTEPKFIPEKAVRIELSGGGSFRARLIDCVGYMVEGAMGHEENDRPRMVKSPWFDHEVPFDLAAETGTRKVICEHSTIGIVVTTDGSVSDIPREGYARTEKRIVEELDALGKPYIILLNSTHPDAPETKQLAEGMARDYDHTVLPVSCVDLDAEALGSILRQVLYEFPVRELDFALPRWVTMLENGHWLQTQVYEAAMQLAEKVSRMKDVPSGTNAPALECDAVQRSSISGIDLAAGSVRITVELKPEIFYQVLSEQTGLAIGDEAGLMPCIMELARAKREYEKVRSALEQVEATGYGIVMPSVSELKLEQPQIVRQGASYGVRLEACAPSIQMLKATIHTELSPIVGTEKQSEELARSLLAGHSAAVAAPLIASARRNAGGVPLCRRYASTVGAARVGAVVICFIPSHSACGSFADYLSAVGAARENVIQKGGMSLAGQSACIFAGHGAAPVVAVCHCDASSAQKAARIISAADRQVFSNDITQLQRSFALYNRHKATAA